MFEYLLMPFKLKLISSSPCSRTWACFDALYSLRPSPFASFWLNTAARLLIDATVLLHHKFASSQEGSQRPKLTEPAGRSRYPESFINSMYQRCARITRPRALWSIILARIGRCSLLHMAVLEHRTITFSIPLIALKPRCPVLEDRSL